MGRFLDLLKNLKPTETEEEIVVSSFLTQSPEGSYTGYEINELNEKRSSEWSGVSDPPPDGEPPFVIAAPSAIRARCIPDPDVAEGAAQDPTGRHIPVLRSEPCVVADQSCPAGHRFCHHTPEAASVGRCYHLIQDGPTVGTCSIHGKPCPRVTRKEGAS